MVDYQALISIILYQGISLNLVLVFIHLAKNDNNGFRIPVLVPLIALVLFYFGNIYESFWHFSHLSFLIIIMVILNYSILWLKSKDLLNRFFLFFGTISMPLFLVSGFLRRPFIAWAMDVDNWALTIALCFLSVAISVVLSLVLLKINVFVTCRKDR